MQRLSQSARSLHARAIVVPWANRIVRPRQIINSSLTRAHDKLNSTLPSSRPALRYDARDP
ncbi:MAG: hypothetical protein QOJ06_2281 [Pseudonocardiales bacterium]|jgi:hypothetical protein|nr:hypothetical protein [Pseudonocardiales bacterium]